MAEQYAVVYFPYPTLVAEVVGPFRAEWRAAVAAAEIAAASEGREAATAPSVVRLASLDQALDDLAEPDVSEERCAPTSE